MDGGIGWFLRERRRNVRITGVGFQVQHLSSEVLQVNARVLQVTLLFQSLSRFDCLRDSVEWHIMLQAKKTESWFGAFHLRLCASHERSISRKQVRLAFHNIIQMGRFFVLLLFFELWHFFFQIKLSFHTQSSWFKWVQMFSFWVFILVDDSH